MDIAYKRGFENLEVWKVAREIRQYISLLCAKIPKNEQYLLIAQVKRSSRSITANIAEGYGRFHYQENIQFCRQSRGSLEETKDHLYVALDEGYITKDEMETFKLKFELSLKLLNGYIGYIENQKLKIKA